jgi:hypothetical protein
VERPRLSPVARTQLVTIRRPRAGTAPTSNHDARAGAGVENGRQDLKPVAWGAGWYTMIARPTPSGRRSRDRVSVPVGPALV